MSSALLANELDRLQDKIKDRNSGFRIRYEGSGEHWYVEVIEIDDRHIFVEATGGSTEEAAANALAEIPEMLAFWGWDDVEWP